MYNQGLQVARVQKDMKNIHDECLPQSLFCNESDEKSGKQKVKMTAVQ